MTEKQMVRILVDKGHTPDYAEHQAAIDFLPFHYPAASDHSSYDCSICRRSFAEIQWRYHYHPCE